MKESMHSSHNGECAMQVPHGEAHSAVEQSEAEERKLLEQIETAITRADSIYEHLSTLLDSEDSSAQAIDDAMTELRQAHAETKRAYDSYHALLTRNLDV